MWVIDPDKERMQHWIRADIRSSITNLSDMSNKIQNVMSVVLCAVGGSGAGMDMRMNDFCRRSLMEISEAQVALQTGLTYTDSLNIEIWVSD